MDPKAGHLFKRKGSDAWQLRIYVPPDVQALGAPKELVRSMRTTDWATASQKAGATLEEKRAEWHALRDSHALNAARALSSAVPTEDDLLAFGLQTYHRAREVLSRHRGVRLAHDPEGYADHLLRQERKQPGYVRDLSSGNVDRWNAATEKMLADEGFVIERDSDAFSRAAEIIAEATLAAINVENRRERGELGAKPSSAMLERAEAIAAENESSRKDIAFGDLVKAFMRQWKAGKAGKKETNTEQQKLATFKLFGGFWDDKAIRLVKPAHAAEFYDKLKLFDPNWSRSPKTRDLGWKDLLERYGDQERGLAAATMNRHMATLQSLWLWAKKRGHCEGDNPFDGFHVKLREGVNVDTYLPWENDELELLLAPPPKRQDLLEVMIVAMFSGMRLDEIASLTWDKLRTETFDGAEISYFDVTDAKTPSGWRYVPVHSSLGWLLGRERGADDVRIWPTFNLEGVGKKAGADAGRLFSEFKIGRGFADRQKTFHSFRKNVTRIMEHASVPENEWAQVFGHERGFTYGTYNPHGIKLDRRVEIIELIDYAGLNIPHPTD